MGGAAFLRRCLGAFGDPDSIPVGLQAVDDLSREDVGPWPYLRLECFLRWRGPDQQAMASAQNAITVQKVMMERAEVSCWR
jgi:hypothetical protein